jgi:4-aminobutyrate aminotransferase-like enzyme
VQTGSRCAGLATLDVLEEERLGERAEHMGDMLRQRLSETLAPPYEIFKAAPGIGLL